ncbi:hypothetical protein LIER_23236 [Lithospermum erythrorhizon]|uniref:Uncharacterized protein n=1 Tax=Lithospermum erythrorhizon TaxID=34254 RepID=A0AAV3R0E1_LITER
MEVAEQQTPQFVEGLDQPKPQMIVTVVSLSQQSSHIPTADLLSIDSDTLYIIRLFTSIGAEVTYGDLAFTKDHDHLANIFAVGAGDPTKIDFNTMINVKEPMFACVPIIARKSPLSPTTLSVIPSPSAISALPLLHLVQATMKGNLTPQFIKKLRPKEKLLS